jgi:acetyl-CoA carboxylase biotin carboxyl carrier protein
MALTIESQVSGTVWKVETPFGQTVTEGDVIFIVESMKMEIPIGAAGAGTITVLVAECETVKEGQVLATVS